MRGKGGSFRMNKIIAFDLETIANKSMVPFLPDVKPSRNLKDPKKIEADIKEFNLDFKFFNKICHQFRC